MENCVTRVECQTCQSKYDAENDRQNHRISALEENMKQLQDLTVSINRMAVSLDQMTKEIARQGQKLEAIEAEPGQKWKQAVWLVASILITAAFTYILTGAK